MQVRNLIAGGFAAVALDASQVEERATWTPLATILGWADPFSYYGRHRRLLALVTGLRRVVLALLAVHLTRDPRQVALVTVAATLPRLLFGLPLDGWC